MTNVNHLNSGESAIALHALVIGLLESLCGEQAYSHQHLELTNHNQQIPKNCRLGRESESSAIRTACSLQIECPGLSPAAFLFPARIVPSPSQTESGVAFKPRHLHCQAQYSVGRYTAWTCQKSIVTADDLRSRPPP